MLQNATHQSTAAAKRTSAVSKPSRRSRNLRLPQDGDTIKVSLDRSGGWETERAFRFGPETELKPSDGGPPILGPQSPMRRALIESLEDGKKSGAFTCECGTGERERKIKLVRIIRAGAH